MKNDRNELQIKPFAFEVGNKMILIDGHEHAAWSPSRRLPPIGRSIFQRCVKWLLLRSPQIDVQLISNTKYLCFAMCPGTVDERVREREEGTHNAMEWNGTMKRTPKNKKANGTKFENGRAKSRRKKWEMKISSLGARFFRNDRFIGLSISFRANEKWEFYSCRIKIRDRRTAKRPSMAIKSKLDCRTKKRHKIGSWAKSTQFGGNELQWKLAVVSRSEA